MQRIRQKSDAKLENTVTILCLWAKNRPEGKPTSMNIHMTVYHHIQKFRHAINLSKRKPLSDRLQMMRRKQQHAQCYAQDVLYYTNVLEATFSIILLSRK